MNEHILSNKILAMKESATLAMTTLSRKLKDKGIDVIALSIGEPDFDTPNDVKEAGKQAIDDNFTHYPPVPGFMNVRQAIADKLKRDNGLDYKASQIVISNGAKQSIANIFMCILNEGDEVIIPAPYWVSYPSMVELGNGTSVFVDAGIEQDYKVTPEQIEAAITPKTKAILFNSPSNPTGSVYTIEEIKAMAEMMKRHPNVLLISDEIYELNIFEGEHLSPASFEDIKDQVVIVNGVSKGFAMTGWRIGYIAAPEFLAKACSKLQGQYTSGAGTISQMAAMEAVKTDPTQSAELKTMIAAFKERRNLLIRLIKEIPGIKTNLPNGAFYLFPDFSHYFGKTNGETTINTSTDMCMYLLNKAHVALVPGDAFGSPNSIRISYAASEEELKEAIKRIKPALENLRKI